MSKDTPDDQTIRRIESILTKGYGSVQLHAALHDNGFPVGYNRLLNLLEQKNQISTHDILGCILNSSSEAPYTPRPPTSENEKHANRRDPLEVAHPVVKQKNWLKKYDDPSVVFSTAESKGDIQVANMMSEEARVAFEASGNMLHVLEAFFQRVDLLVGKLSEIYVREVTHADLAGDGVKDSPCELHDGCGLYLLIFPDGTKEWHLAYRFSDKPQDYRVGNYPDYSLSYARRFSLAAHDLLRNGKDPVAPEHKNELNARIECVYDTEPDVPIPAWMALALADGFKHYYSRRFLHQEAVSLDNALGIDGKKNQEEIDIFTIETRKLVEKTRELQWYFGLSFATCCKIAEKVLRVEMTGQEELPDGSKRDLYHFKPIPLKNICEQESRGAYGNFAGWCERHNRTLYASELCRNDYLKYLASLDKSLAASVEESLNDERKKMRA